MITTPMQTLDVASQLVEIPDYVSCYKFYDERWRRLAAYARYTDPTTVEIFVLTCSNSDQFSRKFARQKYEEYLTTGTTDTQAAIYNILIQPEDLSLGTLLEFMFHKYFRLSSTTIEVPALCQCSCDMYQQVDNLENPSNA